VEKPKAEGPAAYVFPADDLRPGAQAELLRVLQRQGCEVDRARAEFEVSVPVRKNEKDKDKDKDDRAAAPPRERAQEAAATGEPTRKPTESEKASDKVTATAGEKPKTEKRRFPAGSYVVRMDQPYSRIADMLLDYQYWS